MSWRDTAVTRVSRSCLSRSWKITPVETSPQCCFHRQNGGIRSGSTLTPEPCSHLCQDVLALPGKQVLEPVKGEVVSQAQGGAGGIAHVVRAVPLPVPTDTGNKMGGGEGGALGRRFSKDATHPPGGRRKRREGGLPPVDRTSQGPAVMNPHIFRARGPGGEGSHAAPHPRHEAKKGPGWLR